jgi:hypothetical protein
VRGQRHVLRVARAIGSVGGHEVAAGVFVHRVVDAVPSSSSHS